MATLCMHMHVALAQFIVSVLYESLLQLAIEHTSPFRIRQTIN